MPDDLAAVYEVCLRTADAGGDASHLYTDPLLPGHVWAAAYVTLEPSLAFVLEDREGVAGSVLGALDTVAFEQRCEVQWWPMLRLGVDDPAAVPSAERTLDQHAASMIHHPTITPVSITDRYPSHLHINVLPRAQGGGTGRRLMNRVLEAIRLLGSPAVHLGVSSANTNAIAFYEHLGWHVVDDSGPDGIVMGLRLDS